MASLPVERERELTWPDVAAVGNSLAMLGCTWVAWPGLFTKRSRPTLTGPIYLPFSAECSAYRHSFPVTRHRQKKTTLTLQTLAPHLSVTGLTAADLGAVMDLSRYWMYYVAFWLLAVIVAAAIWGL